MPTAPAQPGIHIYTAGDYPNLNRQNLLRACAQQEANLRGLSTESFAVAQGVFGKPYFPGLPSLHFSISHSGFYWLAAFAAQPLGTDLQLHDARDYLRIAKRWFHPQELAYVEKHGQKAFYEVWSSKESYLKYTGRGLSSTLPGFSVVEQDALKKRLGETTFLRPSFQENYSLTLCTAFPQPLCFLTL